MHNWLLLYICRKNTYQSAVIRSISQYIAPKFASLSQPQKPEVALVGIAIWLAYLTAVVFAAVALRIPAQSGEDMAGFSWHCQLYVWLELLRPVGPRRQPFSFIRAWDRLVNVLLLASTPQATVSISKEASTHIEKCGRSVASSMQMRRRMIVV